MTKIILDVSKMKKLGFYPLFNSDQAVKQAVRGIVDEMWRGR